MDLITSISMPVNLPYTIALGFVMLYWLTVIIGALDIEIFEFDLDLDALEGGDSLLASVLSFFCLGKIPVSILGSFVILFSWNASLLLNEVFNAEGSGVIALMFAPGILLGSAFLTKVCMIPFGNVFAQLNQSGSDYRDLVGKVAKVVTSEVTASFGQIEIDEAGSSPLLLHAVSISDESIRRGDPVLIIEHDKEKNIYKVSPLSDPLLKP